MISTVISHFSLNPFTLYFCTFFCGINQEEERERRNRLKSDYFALLDSFTDKIVKRDFRKARHYIESDDRFLNIERKHRREDWFEEWQKTAYKEYKKRRKRIKEAAINEFETRLRASGLVTLESEWDAVRQAIDFGEESFMREVSDRGQRKVFDEIMGELEDEERRKEEEAKAERKRIHKMERTAFGQFVDELVAERKICARSKWDDTTVQKVLSEKGNGDNRYERMVEAQQHRMEGVFVERMEALKEALADSKRVFKQFMKTLKGTTKEVTVSEEDSLESVVLRFKALLEGEGVGEDGAVEPNEKLAAMKGVSGDDVELLLMEYMIKKRRQRDNKENKEEDDTDRGVADRVEMKIALKSNLKKRARFDEAKEVSPEPQRKRQKVDHQDPTEAMELEEGEVSEEDEVKSRDDANGYRSSRNRRSGSSRSSQSSESPHDRKRDGHYSPSRSRSRSHGKHGRHHRRERGSRRRHADKGRERTSYGDIVYGIGSDLDEDDLYYKGGVKGYHELSEGTDEATSTRNGGTAGDKKEVRRRRDHLDMSLEEMNGRRAGTGGNVNGGGHWRRDPQRHPDLDRVDYPTERDAQIDANSYNLDNEEASRWNTAVH